MDFEFEELGLKPVISKIERKETCNHKGNVLFNREEFFLLLHRVRVDTQARPLL